MSNAKNKTFEIIIGTDKTTLSVASVEAVADYFRPGHPDLTIVKRGYTTWRLVSAGRVIGSVRELS